MSCMYYFPKLIYFYFKQTRGCNVKEYDERTLFSCCAAKEGREVGNSQVWSVWYVYIPFFFYLQSGFFKYNMLLGHYIHIQNFNTSYWIIDIGLQNVYVNASFSIKLVKCKTYK